MFRNIDLQYVRNSVARLSERTYYASAFKSWTKFRRLVGRDQYLKSDADEGINELALVDFSGWCSASQGNQAGTISSKLADVQFFHVLAVGLRFQRNRRSSNARCKESAGHTLPRAHLVRCAVRCRGICLVLPSCHVYSAIAPCNSVFTSSPGPLVWGLLYDLG